MAEIIPLQQNIVQNLKCIDPSRWVDNLVLTPAVEKSYTVPAQITRVHLKYDSYVYVNFNGTASIPSGDVITGAGSVLNPETRNVVPGQVINFMSNSAAVITIECFGD